MDIKIIGVADCAFCEKAKWLVQMPNLGATVQAITVSRDMKPEIVALIGRDFETYPLILIDGEYIGGYTELTGYITIDGYGDRNG
jgi:glutaredoxin